MTKDQAVSTSGISGYSNSLLILNQSSFQFKPLTFTNSQSADMKGRTDLRQTCSSSLMAAMLFWNLSRLQKVVIPSFLFWTRTCSRPPGSRFSSSELSCLQQRRVKSFSDCVIEEEIYLWHLKWVNRLLVVVASYRMFTMAQCVVFIPAKDCVFL